MLEKERNFDQSHVKSKLERLDLLEREYSRLTTMQCVAEVSPVPSASEAVSIPDVESL